MTIHFSKYHGAGNDFIIIDNRTAQLLLSPDIIANLCHRQFGIGADGLMLLETDSSSDFRMRYYNSDGFEGTMCGNGGRCIALFANTLGIFTEQTTFSGVDGEHIAVKVSDNIFRLKMIDVTDIQVTDDLYLIDTGSPHLVQFVMDTNKVDVTNQGRLMRNTYGKQPKGVNVNFAQFSPDGIKIRTFERGVEAETLACGTGAVATAIASNHWYNEDRNIYNLHALGGNLTVTFDRISKDEYRNVWLQGPAVHVFDGEIAI